jgi:hypothetical protein
MIVAILFAAVLLFANLPGNPLVGPSILSTGKYGNHFECYERSVVHGWPFTYLQHDGYFHPVTRDLSAWRVGDNVDFEPGLAVLNLVSIAIATCALFVFLRRRLTTHGWRFSVSHLLLAVLCVAVGAAFIRQRYALHQAQLAHLARLKVNPTHAEWHVSGPYWLREISGSRPWEWGDRLAGIDLQDSHQMANLPGKSSIKVVRLVGSGSGQMPSLEEFRELEAVDLCFAGLYPDPTRCLRSIARSPSLQGLNLYEAGVTDQALKELVPLRKLAYLELTHNRDITDRGISHLESMKSLRRLGLYGTGVTKSGVERLRTALPQCEIDWSE